LSGLYNIENINNRIRFAYSEMAKHEAGWSQRRFAAMSGLSKSYAHRLVSEDNMKIPDRTLRSIATALRVDFFWLKTGYGFPYPKEFSIAYPFKPYLEDDEFFYHVEIHGGLTRMSQSEIESRINIEPGTLPEWLSQYEHMKKSNMMEVIAEEQAPYSVSSATSELLSVIAQLDAADQERILQEAKDRLLLKKLKEQIDRGQPGGGSQERQRPAIPPQPQKKGRRQTA